MFPIVGNRFFFGLPGGFYSHCVQLVGILRRHLAGYGYAFMGDKTTDLFEFLWVDFGFDDIR